jgi:hypothetical protein
LREANELAAALNRSARKIFVFFSLVIILATIFGCLIYVVEGSENGFHTIPKSIYWAIVTITTVGYGDIVPQTAIGRAISAIGMLIGYAVIAVPTGIVTAELTLSEQARRERTTAQSSRPGENAPPRSPATAPIAPTWKRTPTPTTAVTVAPTCRSQGTGRRKGPESVAGNRGNITVGIRAKISMMKCMRR